jgi:hypothetical protein
MLLMRGMDKRFSRKFRWQFIARRTGKPPLDAPALVCWSWPKPRYIDLFRLQEATARSLLPPGMRVGGTMKTLSHFVAGCMLVTAACAAQTTGSYEARLEAEVKQAIAARPTCDAWMAELKRTAVGPGDVGRFPDKATALRVLGHLEKRPLYTPAAKRAAELFLNAPDSADRARIGRIAKDMHISCGLLKVCSLLEALLDQREELGFSAGESARVLSASQAYLKAESEYPGSLAQSAVLVSLLETMAAAGALEVSDDRITALREKFEATRADLLPGTRDANPADMTQVGAFVLLEFKVSNEVRLLAKEIMP